MKLLITTLILAMLTTTSLLSQETKIKLPSKNNSSSFTVTGTDADRTMKFFGDGGFYLSGDYGAGTIPITGEGIRLMWYPNKAAFRVGRVNGTQWNDDNIGDFSTAMGINTTASGAQSTAMGVGTKASGTASTAMGNFTTANGDYSTTMGCATAAGGENSTAMGYFTTASGDYSTAIGYFASTNSHIGAFVIGDKSTSAYVYVLAEQDNQMVMRFKGGYKLYTNAQMDKGVLMNQGDNSWSSISDSTKKTNFLDADGEYFLNSLSKLKLGSWNYKNQNPETFRHYGPMAQEVYRYFGKDEYGTIGNDTTIASADMDGIMMIALQALEKRTRDNAELIIQNAELIKENAEIRNEIAEMAIALKEQKHRLSNQQNTIEEMATKLLAIEIKLDTQENKETISTSNNSAEKKEEL